MVNALATNGRRLLLLRALQAADVGIGAFALGLALDWQGPGVSVFLADASWREVSWLALTLVVWHVLFCTFGLYESRRLSRGAGEVWALAKGVTFATIVTAALALLLGVESASPSVVFTVWAAGITLGVISRISMRLFLALLRRSGRNLRFILLIGGGPRARRLLDSLAVAADLGYRVAGYLDVSDDGKYANDGNDRNGTPLPGLPYLGAISGLPAVLKERVIDEVFIALPIKSFYEETARAIQWCEEQGVRVRLPADFFDPVLSTVQVDSFEGLPVISVVPHWVGGWYAIAKRALDLAASLVLLGLAAPVFALVALLIKLDSPGPVFFVQERVGLNKRHFRMFKFRTMQQNSEARLAEVAHLNEAEGPVFKIRDDPRLTRVGRLLRRLSIDELPQLLNVVRGEMSLVGPRPLPLRDVEGFTENWQRRRFSVKPGITCLWQISGRSRIPFRRWMELDMEYIDTSSMWLDLKILLKTVRAVFHRTGAY